MKPSGKNNRETLHKEIKELKKELKEKKKLLKKEQRKF